MNTRTVAQPRPNESIGTGPISRMPSFVQEVLHSPGQQLDTSLRVFMETGFGHDFTQVKVHTDENASLAARAINALAFTVGSHIAVRNDKYTPHTLTGRKLLAHELAHVVQQSRGSSGSEPEVRADLASQAIISGREVEAKTVGTAPAGLYRQHDGSEPPDNLEDFVKKMRSSWHQKKDILPSFPADSPASMWRSKFMAQPGLYGQPYLIKPRESFDDFEKRLQRNRAGSGSSVVMQESIPAWVKPGIDLHLKNKTENEEFERGNWSGEAKVFEDQGPPELPPGVQPKQLGGIPESIGKILDFISPVFSGKYRFNFNRPKRGSMKRRRLKRQARRAERDLLDIPEEH